MEPIKHSKRKTFVLGRNSFTDFIFSFSALLIGAITFIVTLIRYKPTYPDWNVTAIIILLLSFVPGLVMLCIRNTKYGKNEILTAVLSQVCYFCLPIATISAMSTIGFVSVTSQIHNYRALDPRCDANNNLLFQELFPTQTNFVGFINDGTIEYNENSEYYYCYHTTSTYDIYAQWPLDEAEFATEKERVRTLFEHQDVNQKACRGLPFWEYKDFLFYEQTVGDYHCLMIYDGFDKPFEETSSDEYSYWMFAYNDKENLVRYLHGANWSVEDMQPYYLSLSW